MTPGFPLLTAHEIKEMLVHWLNLFNVSHVNFRTSKKSRRLTESDETRFTLNYFLMGQNSQSITSHSIP